MKILSLCAAALLLGSASTRADDDDYSRNRPGTEALTSEQKRVRAEVRERYDRNKDGKLDETERRAISAEDRARVGRVIRPVRPPGQSRADEVHERNAERKEWKNESKEEGKAAKEARKREMKARKEARKDQREGWKDREEDLKDQNEAIKEEREAAKEQAKVAREQQREADKAVREQRNEVEEVGREGRSKKNKRKD